MAADWQGEAESSSDRLSRFDASTPHPARVYDAWLGGKNNFAADRAAAEAGLRAFPATVKSVRANRAFLARAVRYLVSEAGVRQFLDIGTGLPSADNTHEVAQAIAPECRVVYVDNDPVVLRHAEALLTSVGPGVVDYIDADLRDPGKILREASRTLDFAQPVAITLIAVLHFISDEEDPYQLVDTLMDVVPLGSYLALSHTASDIFPEELAAFASAMNQDTAQKVTLRNREQVAGLFRRHALIDPGVVQISKWRPRSELEAAAPAVLWGGIARKTA